MTDTTELKPDPTPLGTSRLRAFATGVIARVRVSWWMVVYFVLVIAGLLVSSHGRHTPYNNEEVLAHAMLQGHLWVDRHDTLIDSLAYNGKNWIIEGPVPAILLIPFVFLFGDANETTEALILCVIALGFAWKLLRNIGLSDRQAFPLMLFLFAGTDLWWCSMLGDVWFISHTAAVTFTMIALAEVFGRRRGWVIGLCAILALGCRFSLAAALPFYIAVLLGDDPALRRRRLIGFGSFVLPGIVLWMVRNFVQYGTINDAGYTLFYYQDPWGQQPGGPFRLAYFPYEFWSYFLQAPVLAEWRQQAIWPIFKLDNHGLALTFTSPALILAFLAPRNRMTLMLWITTALVAAPSFIYYLNGWLQFGMRHALDFEPFLFVLMALAIKERGRIPNWGYALLTWSVLVGVWGVWWWDTFVRTTD
jgi:hypothetical protein